MSIQKIDYSMQPAQIIVDREAIESKVRGMIEPYCGITPEIVAGMDLKEAKRCRADLNAISKELNDARKAVKREYNKPLANFEAWCKEVDSMIIGPCEVIKQGIAVREQQAKDERMEALREAYLDAAPVLAEAVDFETILEPQWLNASFGAVKAENALMEKVALVADDLKTLEAMSFAFPDEAKAVFCRTLSIKEARENDERRRIEADRIKAMEEQREQMRKDAFFEEMREDESTDDAPRYEYNFTVRCDEMQFEMIRAFLDENGIEKVGAKRSAL